MARKAKNVSANAGATAVADTQDVDLSSAKVKKLTIKNFRCIGSDPIEIELDDIVVLVGPNNAGKSTILRAYELIMNHGSKEGQLSREDFPNEEIKEDSFPEITLETYLGPEKENRPGEHWIFEGGDYGYIVERWIWSEPAAQPKRQGKLAGEGTWSDEVQWGAPNVAKAYRPKPHRVDAFASPEDQGAKIAKILQDILLEQQISAAEAADDMAKLEATTRALKQKYIDISRDKIAEIENLLGENVKKIFDGFDVKLDPRDSDVPAVDLFSAKPLIRMGPTSGHMAPLEKQGIGARRTLLWSALKVAAERQVVKPKGRTEGSAKARPNVLLLDEPEICLHPAAIREACKVLYDLATSDTGWQVMVTTHSPQFIDISRDNTTVVRVERRNDGKIETTTVFRPSRSQLSEEDKEALKLLNLWDPHVAEFFFGTKTIVVEGDTEYAAFKEIAATDPNRFKSVHIIRARGKWVIPALIKILGHFGASCAILHDTDTKENTDGSTNSAWAANGKILEAVNGGDLSTRMRLAASIVDFEVAIFGKAKSREKPYSAVNRIRTDPEARQRVTDLLMYLIFERDVPPEGVLEWNSLDQLEKAVASATGS